jgi:hypothetical protein
MVGISGAFVGAAVLATGAGLIAPRTAHAGLDPSPPVSCAEMNQSTFDDYPVTFMANLEAGDKLNYVHVADGDFSVPASGAAELKPSGPTQTVGLGLTSSSGMTTIVTTGGYNITLTPAMGGGMMMMALYEYEEDEGESVVSVTCTPDDTNGGSTAGGLLASIGGYNHSRAHTEGLNGNGGNSGTAFSGPLTIADIGNGLTFDIDLGQLMAASYTNAVLAAAESTTGRASTDAGRTSSPLRITISGNYTDFEDDKSTADRDGDIWRLDVIGSYRVGNLGHIGGFVGYEEIDVSSTAMASSLDSDNIGGGVFVSLNLPWQTKLTTEFSYMEGDNDAVIGLGTGQFDSRRMEVYAALTKRFEGEVIWTDLTARGSWSNLQRDNFVDSTGAVNGGGVDVVGRFGGELKVGAKIPIRNKHVYQVRPWNEISIDWNFRNEGSFVASSTTVFSAIDLRADVGAGLEIELTNGVSFLAGGTYFATDTRLHGWSVNGALGIPLNSVIPGAGFNDASLLSLDVDQGKTDTSLMATMKFGLN